MGIFLVFCLGMMYVVCGCVFIVLSGFVGVGFKREGLGWGLLRFVGLDVKVVFI